MRLSYKAGPAHALQPDKARRGDWITEVRLNVTTSIGAGTGKALEKIDVAVVNPDKLLRPAVDSALPPVAGMALTTINLTVNGRAVPVGDHTFAAMHVKAKVLSDKHIGNGYAEQIDLEMAGFHLRITSAKAQKFTSPELQVRAVHLDCQFLKIDKTKVRGALPEMWGLVPMSTATAAMLKQPTM